MDADDRARLEAYVRSQNHFAGLSQDVIIAMLEAFIRRALPWLAEQIYDAVSTAWNWIKRQFS
jgi:hypothetical protein